MMATSFQWFGGTGWEQRSELHREPRGTCFGSSLLSSAWSQRELSLQQTLLAFFKLLEPHPLGGEADPRKGFSVKGEVPRLPPLPHLHQ